MCKLTELLHPKVVNLIKTVGAEIRFDDMPCESIRGSAGYWAMMDRISLAVNFGILPPDQRNMIVLHEIIHWTGKSTRLNRAAIREMARGIPLFFLFSELPTEECIAQTGADLLLTQLGLNSPKLKKYTKYYISTWTDDTVDTDNVNTQAQLAVSFLNNLIADTKRKAA
jgi:antirestriction protein ArdC